MRSLILLLKLVVSGSIVWLVWDKFDFSQIQHIFSNPLLLVTIPVCWALNQLLTTLRLHSILKALGRPTQLADVAHANLSSLFVGNLMPGIIGADIIKFFYIKKHDSGMSNTQLAVVLAVDRVLGLIAVLFWCSFFSFFIDINVFDHQKERSLNLLSYLPTILLIGILLALATSKFFIRFFARLPLPELIKKFITTYWNLLTSHKKGTLALVMIYNLSAVLVLLTGLAFIGGQIQAEQNEQITLAFHLFLIPLSIVATMLPITPMGIGVAQITMAGAYELFGLNPAIGVSISTLSQLSLLGISVLVGGPVFLFRKLNFFKAS